MVAATKSDAVTVAFAPEDRERLAKLAEAQGGTVEELVRGLILERLDEEDDLAEVDRRWAQFEQDGLSIPHHEVAAYVRSLGTGQELPCPKPRKM